MLYSYATIPKLLFLNFASDCRTSPYPSRYTLTDLLSSPRNYHQHELLKAFTWSDYIGTPYSGYICFLGQWSPSISCITLVAYFLCRPSYGGTQYIRHLPNLRLGIVPDVFYLKGGAKFFDFYGQPEAGSNRVNLYGHSTNRTWSMKSISIFLFSAPDFQLKNLQKMWVEGMMYNTVWSEGFKLRKVINEWQEYIIM